MFEIFASVVSTNPRSDLLPIHGAIGKRASRLSVPGLGEFHAEPIRNPVTGEEHRARIELPYGFEYKVAEMANCVEHVTLGRETR